MSANVLPKNKKKRLLDSLDAAFAGSNKKIDTKQTRELQPKMQQFVPRVLKKEKEKKKSSDRRKLDKLYEPLPEDILTVAFSNLVLLNSSKGSHYKCKSLLLNEYVEQSVLNPGRDINTLIKKQLTNKSLQLENRQQKSKLTDYLPSHKRVHPSQRKISSKQKNTEGMFKIPSNITFAAMEPLGVLWEDYMRSLIGSETSNARLCGKLHQADYHGCNIEVIDSKCKTLVGKSGIILQETRNILRIITRDDRCIAIPKAGNQFSFKLDSRRFTIYGDNFINRLDTAVTQ